MQGKRRRRSQKQRFIALIVPTRPSRRHQPNQRKRMKERKEERKEVMDRDTHIDTRSLIGRIKVSRDHNQADNNVSMERTG